MGLLGVEVFEGFGGGVWGGELLVLGDIFVFGVFWLGWRVLEDEMGSC